MKYYVAKSYQEWERVNEPYEANGKMYVAVRKPDGSIKIVRAYAEEEYCKLYKEATCASPAMPSGETRLSDHKVKKILGFDEGYIWIFKGDLENAEYWFERTPECRYHTIFGWYIVSTDNIPFDIPSCIESVQLPWEKVGNTDGTLLPKGIITAAVDALRFGNHPSQFQGEVGDRLDLTLYLRQVIDLPETKYGTSRIFCFEDKDSNRFSWNTGVKKEWNIGDEIICRAGVKAHDTNKGIRTTILTRLMEVKKK